MRTLSVSKSQEFKKNQSMKEKIEVLDEETFNLRRSINRDITKLNNREKFIRNVHDKIYYLNSLLPLLKAKKESSLQPQPVTPLKPESEKSFSIDELKEKIDEFNRIIQEYDTVKEKKKSSNKKQNERVHLLLSLNNEIEKKINVEFRKNLFLLREKRSMNMKITNLKAKKILHQKKNFSM